MQHTQMRTRNRKTLIAVLVAAAGFWAAGALAEGLSFRLAMASDPVAAFGAETAPAEAPLLLLESPVVVYGHRDANADTSDALRVDLAAIGMTAIPRDEYSLLSGDDSPSLNLGGPAAGLPQYALATPGATLGSWDAAQANDPRVDAAGHPYVFGLRLAF